MPRIGRTLILMTVGAVVTAAMAVPIGMSATATVASAAAGTAADLSARVPILVSPTVTPRGAAVLAATPCVAGSPRIVDVQGTLAGTTATLTAHVDPNGSASKANFEWGPTTSLGHGTPKTALGSGCSVMPVSAAVNGLSAGQSYYFRVIVESPNGNVYPAPIRLAATGQPAPTSTPTPTPRPTATPTATATPTLTTPTPTVTPTPTTAAPGGPFPERLHAVNKAGSEYACAQGWGFFDGPVDTASAQAMRSWKINGVRLPLNESCWLGISDAPAAFSGPAYRSAIEAYVRTLHANGIYVILDLHWSAAGTTLALSQDRMANRDHSVAFWASVAAAFKDDPRTAFDLYNEPHNVTWSVWKSGDATYAGMDDLIAAVRSTGARNWVIASGIEWGNDLRGWLANRPADPIGRVAAGAHIYNFNRCVTSTCWTAELGPAIGAVPLFITELGENDCASSFVSSLLTWADAHDVAGYSAWAWNTSMSCGGGPGLITDYAGTPTAYGAGVRSWYMSH